MKTKLLALSFFLTVFQLFSQIKIVKGTVVAFKKYPVKGVEITSKGSKEKVYTDAEGKFEIQCKSKDKLKAKAGGFFMEKMEIEGEEAVEINLVYDVKRKQFAYNKVLNGNHLSKKVLDHCLENLIEENNNFDQAADIYQIIQTVYPGAKLNNDSGSIRIILNARGENSLFADIHALLVVDGVVVNDISNVSPLQVKSVKVLVGNQAAHWGVRGGNGAVEITLKYGAK
ncbi:TonB-dependent receptor [Flavicella sediminum]|uniref:TonB-dependent receptor n=1 Tax=Flavicella sediminum TaxID=2585141 RepID=UPI001123FD4F|nr:carboxypeptidase-like regulatory domain-containing protein [Flavicella sediminum]